MPAGSKSTVAKPGSRLREPGPVAPKGADALRSLCRGFRGRLAALSERDASGGESQTLHHRNLMDYSTTRPIFDCRHQCLKICCRKL